LALTVYNDELIAAGSFNFAGGVSANYIAKWNGTSWSSLDIGMNTEVYALTVYNGELIAGGKFQNAGNIPVNYIAKWNGSSWAPLGSGMSGVNFPYVYSLYVYGNDLIAGGVFRVAGGANVNCIAKWNGISWSALGSGMGGTASPFVQALTVYGSELIAGGWFATAGGVTAIKIAKWNGTSWAQLSSIFSIFDGIQILALNVYSNDLIVGGWFRTIGGVTTNSITRWNGNSWSPLDSGLFLNENPGYVLALTVYGSDLIAGGNFDTTGGFNTHYIAKWSEPLGINITSNNIPDKFRLYQNYPNPFNPVSKIKFDIAKTSQTKITIFDICGKEITSLVNKQLNAGTYEVNWDASNFPTGVYFYKLTSGEFAETKKMMLIK
jgi:Secretion system C-terminal sorting domain